MQASLHKYILIPYFKFIARFIIKNRAVNIFDAMSDARTILVLMPEEPEEFKVAWEILPALQKKFPKAQLTVVMKELYWKLSRETGHYGMIFVSDTDTNLLGLPHRELIGKVTASKYDIAIDLNYSFNLLSTLICQRSDAPLRICLKDPDRDPFFNVSFRSAEQEPLDSIYRNLFKYLNA